MLLLFTEAKKANPYLALSSSLIPPLRPCYPYPRGVGQAYPRGVGQAYPRGVG